MLSFQHDEREAPLGHIQVNVSSGQLDVHLKLRQETGVTHLGAVISGLWHPGTERQGHQLWKERHFLNGCVSLGLCRHNLPSHQDCNFLGHFVSYLLRTSAKLLSYFFCI